MSNDTLAPEQDVIAIAAELEGLIPLDPATDLAVIRRVERFKAARAAKAAAEAEMKSLRDAILKDIKDHGAQALTLDDHVMARRSEVTTTSVDSAKLKALAPEVYGRVLKSTKSIRLVVEKD